jgi:hypothetical protein
MSKFNICVSGMKGTFIETTNALKHSLEELGHQVDHIVFGKKPSPYIPNEITIIIMGKAEILPLSKSSLNIFFCMEQWRNEEKAIKIRSQFDHIFDIFNHVHRNYPKKSILCPLGWSKSFETDLSISHNQNNFFLFGSGNPTYRNKWINQNKHLITYFREGCFGIKRDKYIIDSKINLMIKGYNKWVLPPLHMLLIISKKKFLMMDNHIDYYPYEPGKHFILFDKFPQDCEYWLNNDKARKEFEISVYEDIKKNHNFTIYLERALNEIH